MRCSVCLWWHRCTKAKDWDLLVRVVVLQDVAHGLDGVKILVFVHVEIVERISIRGVTIAQRKVDCDAQLNLASTKDVLQKRVPLVEHNAVEPRALILTSTHQLELKLTFAKLSYVAADVAKVDVLAALLRLEELDSNLALRVLIRQLRGQDRDQVPGEAPAQAARDLALVDGLVLAWAHELVDQEEVEAVLRRKGAAQLEVSLLVVDTLALVCNDLDRSALTGRPLVTH